MHTSETRSGGRAGVEGGAAKDQALSGLENTSRF